MRPMFRHPIRFMRDHRFTQSRASDFLDGELGGEDRARVQEHARVCPGCHHLLDSLRRTIGGLRGLPRQTDDGIAPSVIARLRDEP